ncbi:PD-(D/E)XK motif protein [Caulobacter sp. ErkDOM-E]|uniref:PD-(D/E)XK motif protein n=1 Tax=Caulobacter sp. ErkDOM-E TaxID=3402778 RepID=UPI003AF64BAC
MTADPWSSIGRAQDGMLLRRVDPSHAADFFWARDAGGRCALVLVTPEATQVDDARPELNGIEIVEAPDQDGKHAFVLVLRREEDRELFRKLCDDIVDACRGLSGPQAFLTATIRRAWKWHSLLRGATRPRLGPEEQQGLIGELLFLERLASTLTPKTALEAWRGPLGEPKDFAFGGRAVEVKSRHIGKDAIKVSSEHQLQLVEGQDLFLLVHALTPTAPETASAFTLDMLVERVRKALCAADPSSEEGFEARLLSVGYSVDHDYGDAWWSAISTSAFRVNESFPRLEASSLPTGVSNVSYWLALNICAPFEVADIDILSTEKA